MWAENRTSAVDDETYLVSTFLKYLPSISHYKTLLFSSYCSSVSLIFLYTKLYPAVGNHESVPVNEFAPRSVGGYFNMSWLYNALAERWSSWIPLPAVQQVQYPIDIYLLPTFLIGLRWAGYYTTLTPDGARIISLNTNLGCNNENWFLTFPSPDSADPDGQLQWFADTLAAAEKNNEYVYQ